MRILLGALAMVATLTLLTSCEKQKKAAIEASPVTQEMKMYEKQKGKVEDYQKVIDANDKKAQEVIKGSSN